MEAHFNTKAASSVNTHLYFLPLAAALSLTIMAASSAAQSGLEPTVATGATPAVPISVRDADGQIVIRAPHLREHIVIDGKLEDSFYTRFQPASGFVQVEPAYG